MPKQKQTPRDHRRYQLRQKRKVVHEGITGQDLADREAQHQKEYPDSKASQVGPVVTKKTALDWEQSRPRRPLVRRPPEKKLIR